MILFWTAQNKVSSREASQSDLRKNRDNRKQGTDSFALEDRAFPIGQCFDLGVNPDAGPYKSESLSDELNV